ncbi:hypothetical protein MAR_005978 [Mya arenaria]|uniref:Uncharacterized protein n=1 Tax=Mya arenaria TaxID=6604 RepID=A0ABY7D770_MYAAR|nr:uncharacterized protein LOC128205223 [Mya arenaria]WAQ93507.1 hypothetical protein MAR_005978 [Mya arenaria]
MAASDRKAFIKAIGKAGGSVLPMKELAVSGIVCIKKDTEKEHTLKVNFNIQSDGNIVPGSTQHVIDNIQRDSADATELKKDIWKYSQRLIRYEDNLHLFGVIKVSHQTTDYIVTLKQTVGHPTGIGQKQTVGHSTGNGQKQTVGHPTEKDQKQTVGHPTGKDQKQTVGHSTGNGQKQTVGHSAGKGQKQSVGHSKGIGQNQAVGHKQTEAKTVTPKVGKTHKEKDDRWSQDILLSSGSLVANKSGTDLPVNNDEPSIPQCRPVAFIEKYLAKTPKKSDNERTSCQKIDSSISGATGGNIYDCIKNTATSKPSTSASFKMEKEDRSHVVLSSLNSGTQQIQSTKVAFSCGKCGGKELQTRKGIISHIKKCAMVEHEGALRYIIKKEVPWHPIQREMKTDKMTSVKDMKRKRDDSPDEGIQKEVPWHPIQREMKTDKMASGKDMKRKRDDSPDEGIQKGVPWHPIQREMETDKMASVKDMKRKRDDSPDEGIQKEVPWHPIQCEIKTDKMASGKDMKRKRDDSPDEGIQKEVPWHPIQREMKTDKMASVKDMKRKRDDSPDEGLHATPKKPKMGQICKIC